LGLMYAVVPVADADEIGANFGLKKGELRPGKVHKVSGGMLPGLVILLKGKHLYVALGEAAFAHLADGKPVTSELSPDQSTTMIKADLAVHVSLDELLAVFPAALDELEKNMKRGDPADDSESKKFVEALRQVRFVVAGLSLDHGGRVNVITTFHKGKDGEA